MSDIEKLRDKFIKDCVEEADRIYPHANNINYLHQMIIQLIGKVFELEEQIKELKNVQ
jgi:hypothetical protein